MATATPTKPQSTMPTQVTPTATTTPTAAASGQAMTIPTEVTPIGEEADVEPVGK